VHAHNFTNTGISALSKVEGYFKKVGGERRAKLGKQI
jgi:hypothetical protein